MDTIFIGTSSFADPLMAKYFYPANLPPAEKISYYAAHFNTVEVDSSFYALPSERNSVLFASRTPPGFIFHFKAFGLMTGHPVEVKRLGRTLRSYLPADFSGEVVRKADERLLEQAFRMFWSALQPLKRANKLGYVLLQYPPWFKKSDENIEFIKKARELLPDAGLAVEFRNGTWLLDGEREDTLAFLKELGMVYVIVDEPQVGVYGSVPPVVAVTAGDSYIRFHGRNRENWLKKGITARERFKYLYSDEELEPWSSTVRQLSSEVNRVYVLFNNCFAYYALKNARRFADMLDVLKDRQPLNINETLFPE